MTPIFRLLSKIHLFSNDFTNTYLFFTYIYILFIELSGTGVSKLVSDDGKSGKLNGKKKYACEFIYFRTGYSSLFSTDLVYSNDTELVDREKTTKENKKKQPNQSIRRPRNNTENELTPIAKRLRRR